MQLYIPIYSCIDISMDINNNINYAIIAIHGLLRNVDDIFCLGLQIIKNRKDTIFIAPYYTIDELNTTDWGTNIFDVRE